MHNRSFTSLIYLDIEWIVAQLCQKPLNRDFLVEEESVFGILYHPFQTLIEIFARHRTAWKDSPFVSFDWIQVKTL